MTTTSRLGTILVLSSGLFCTGTATAQSGTSGPNSPAQIGAPAPQQDGPPRHGGVEHRVEMLQRELALNSDQTAKVRALLVTEHTQLEALRFNSALTLDQRHTQMVAVRQELDTKMHALLTTEQASRYDAMEARMREHRPGGDGPPPPSSGEGPGTR